MPELAAEQVLSFWLRLRPALRPVGLKCSYGTPLALEPKAEHEHQQAPGSVLPRAERTKRACTAERLHSVVSLLRYTQKCARALALYKHRAGGRRLCAALEVAYGNPIAL
jgi:hypothetical protein